MSLRYDLNFSILPNVSLKHNFAQTLEEYSKLGYTVSALSKDDSVLGLIAYSDSLKPEGRAVVAALSKTGIESFLLTGDKQEAAHQVAED